MNGQRAVQWIGLAVRARKAAVGADAVLRAIQSNRARLVLMAADVGANMAKKYRDKCAYYQVPLCVAFDKRTLGGACGKAETAAVALLDQGFAAKMQEYLKESGGGEAFGETSSI